MRPSAMWRTFSIIALVAIAAGQFVTWPSIHVCVALSADSPACQGASTGCCAGHGTEAGEVERGADQANGSQPLAKDCGCAQCFCKVFPAPAFLTAPNGYVFSLPDSLISGEANLNFPVFDYSQSLFHPPRA